MPNPNDVQTAAAPTRNQAPDRQRLLRHMRDGQQPSPAQARMARMAQAQAALTRELSQAKPLIDQAAPLVANTAIAQPLRDDYTRTRRRFVAATRAQRPVEATARLGEHKRAAVNLLHGEKAAQMRADQIAQQAVLHGEMAAVFTSVKKSSFPDGQAEHIGRQDLSAGRQFKDYLLALAELEIGKQGVDASKPVPAQLADDLKRYCESLIGAADAYLEHYEKDLSSSQQADKASQTKKRYCESGKLSALQYLLALEFDQVGDPKASPQGWDEAAQMRAATVRAKLNYHQAYQAAMSLKEGGDAAGMSESLWLQGAEFGAGDALADGLDAQMANARRKRVAIFKPFEGEQPAKGSTDRPGAGAAKEALAASNAKLFAAQTGIDLGVPETHVVAIPRYAIQGDSKPGTALDGVVGSAQANAGASTDLSKLPAALRDKIDRRDWQKIAMLDIMQLNCDRHEGNLMVRNPDSAHPELVPIDHGGSLPSRSDFAAIKARIGGVTNSANGASITNAMLTTPAAYEAFDPELLARLELLQPADIVAGMQRQLGAMDQVHPSLEASSKVGNDSLQMSKRSMMFMKRAARHLSPAEIQIALAQRGEAMFDAADDAAFNAVADQVIADFLPLKDAYREILTGPIDQVTAMADWLKNNGWGTPGGDHFMMQNPALALKLYQAKKANPNPTPAQEVPAGAKLAVNVEARPTVPAEFKAKYLQEYPDAAKQSNSSWQKNMIAHDQLATMPQARAIYQQVLTLTGALEDDGADSKLKTLACWAELNKSANAALLARLPANGGTSAASVHLAEFLKVAFAQAAVVAVSARARQEAAAISDDDANRLAAEAVLVRVDALAQDALLAASQRALAARTADVRAHLAQQDWEGARALAMPLDAQALTLALETLLALGSAEFEEAMKPVADRSQLQRPVLQKMDDLRDACRFKRSLKAARIALEEMRPELSKFRDHLSALPAFSWDAHAASATKKTAIAAGLIADKDTGMSDALKAVAEAQKAFDEVLGDKTRPEKKRPAGDKALAAYARFIQFMSTRLRPLSDQFVWQNYCAGGVKAANAKIAYIRSLMANWR